MAEELKIPPGWRLVPEEPTQKMIASAQRHPTTRGQYCAMLAASPRPAAGAGCGEGEAQQPVTEADMQHAEAWIMERSGKAAFFPVDANHLASLVMLMIREVRATRRASPAATQAAPTDAAHLERFIRWAEGYGLDTELSEDDGRQFGDDSTELCYLATQEVPDSTTQADAARQARDKLAAFGAWCAEEFRRHLSDVDGGSAQDAMERTGVIVKRVVTEPCGENCVCAEYGDFPHDCYVFPPEVRAAIADGGPHAD